METADANGCWGERAIRILATTYYDLNLEPTFTNMCICQKKTGRFWGVWGVAD
ncbi:hypothetical protein HBI56_054410 [Parastagonospora nodorum]|uniref:Uncharacterized protein n=1 Tax=Phaeosphaeria nodorum (strain SN15 / ATCC MYA-4574 / FGSC 10173) TaxID=321614 RepID=A0A7U2ICN9_PHANO|nr:hypothetical protein HBH56_097710 [Parastagonospora nodorum]QRD07338.1 hypothetical protein JI435_424260 [Parastagonospora nodorum SN15]KAH3930577.1 hypothetical protein HBH54_112040 [Parastagonospora nodorum]KAH3945035.1 hypothetical protein HBH53_147400 [Parastagonospora nodorum]KAH3966898.1 hypothetical protein HBH51_138800 [Parastagonospora nodorum]